MTITTLPTPPTRSDPTNFASRADAFLAALPTFGDEANALAAAMNLNATNDTSTTSNSIGTGAKTFTVSTGKSYVGGMYVVIADTAAPTTNAMIAQVTSYSGSTLVVNVKYIIGSGTKTAWIISQSVPYAEHIDGVPVGATTPSTGAFTTLSASGNIQANGGKTQFWNGSGGTTGAFSWYATANGACQLQDEFAGTPVLNVLSGNLGLGVTPSAWSLGKAIEVGALGNGIWSRTAIVELTSGVYWQSGYKYGNTGNAIGSYQIDSGVHKWYSLGAGTAGTLVNGTGSWTQAMTLVASGDLLLGNTTDSGAISQGFTFAVGGGSLMATGHASGTASGTAYSYFDYNSSVIGSITQSGTTAVLYNTTSDYRLKTVIAPVSGSGSRIDALNPVEYEWKADGTRTRGFLAHEFQAVYAQSVNGTKDAVDADGNPIYQSMQAGSSEVIADLVAEIKSLRARITALEAV